MLELSQFGKKAYTLMIQRIYWKNSCKLRSEMIPNKRTFMALLVAAMISISLSAGANYGILEAARDIGNLNTFSAALDTAGLWEL